MSERKRYDKIPIQGNVYPVPSLMYIQDKVTRFNVLTGQPLGGISSKSGTLDIFMDRKLLQDDNRGLGQGVQDNRRTRLPFKLFFESNPTEPMKPSSDVQKELLTLDNSVIVMESGAVSDQSISFMSDAPASFPCDVHLVNLRTCTRTDDQTGQLYHMTLHRFGSSCETRKCSSSSVNLTKLLNDSIISRIVSTMNQVSLSFMKLIKSGIPINGNVDMDQMDIVVYELTGLSE